ncbi:MAG: hypothetical protein ACRDV7_09020 [Acidimicrobiia bacterium]
MGGPGDRQALVATWTTRPGRAPFAQLAFPEAVCNDVYATEGYEASIGNLARTSLDGDMVFRDGYDTQLASVDGSVDHGFTVALRVPV